MDLENLIRQLEEGSRNSNPQDKGKRKLEDDEAEDTKKEKNSKERMINRLETINNVY